MQARIFALREFVTVGEAGFLALRDERVKKRRWNTDLRQHFFSKSSTSEIILDKNVVSAASVNVVFKESITTKWGSKVSRHLYNKLGLTADQSTLVAELVPHGRLVWYDKSFRIGMKCQPAP